MTSHESRTQGFQRVSDVLEHLRRGHVLAVLLLQLRLFVLPDLTQRLRDAGISIREGFDEFLPALGLTLRELQAVSCLVTVFLLPSSIVLLLERSRTLPGP